MKGILYLLYQPYKWLIFLPILVFSTMVLAVLVLILLMVADARTVSKVCGVTWARINSWATPMFVKRLGRRRIDKNKSYVIVSNHQSLYDILVLYGWMGVDFKWVMKQELRGVPFLGIACEKLGHIFIDRSNRQAALASLKQAKQKIAHGTSVVFFPEGTRSQKGKLGLFKKGAFRMALDLSLPILPVTIMGTADILPARSLNLFPGSVTMKIHPPVPIEEYRGRDIETLILDVKNIIQSELRADGRRKP